MDSHSSVVIHLNVSTCFVCLQRRETAAMLQGEAAQLHKGTCSLADSRSMACSISNTAAGCFTGDGSCAARGGDTAAEAQCAAGKRWHSDCKRFSRLHITVLQETSAKLREEAAQLRKQNALLATEVAGARDSVSQLLDRISGMQVTNLCGLTSTAGS